MKHSRRVVLALTVLVGSYFQSAAQVNSNYQVAPWRGFKKAAVTYTFDDNTGGQVPIAVPLFDRYNYKVTLFTITNSNPNWALLRTASANGHEVTSHTVTHADLSAITVAQQVTELQNSQTTIRTNVPTAKCETIAYPYCRIGDRASIQSYYIAGRVCSGTIIPPNPTDFYQLGSTSTGSANVTQTAAHFNAKVDAARTSGGWCMFLTHGINNDGGYSPTQSTEIAGHLAYVDANKADFWVGTFSEVVKYVKERMALNVSETPVTSDSLRLAVTDNLPNNVYNVPVTIRRQLPTGWTNARLWSGSTLIPSTISTASGVRYVVFEVEPDQGIMYLAKSSVVASTRTTGVALPLQSWPNPFDNSTRLELPGRFAYSVYALDGKLVESGQSVDAVELGKNLAAGAYSVRISQGDRVAGATIIKK